MNEVKTSDVTNALKDIVKFTMLFTVDEAGYVVNESDGARITIPVEDRRAPILLYQEEIRDQEAQILNPFSEGQGQPPSSHWLYRALKAALLGRIKMIMEAVIKAAIMEKSKDKKADDSKRLPMAILSLASLIVDEADAKALQELDQIFANRSADEFLRTYYEKRNLRCNVSSGLFDPEEENSLIPSFRSKFPTIRKKGWGIFEKLLLGILGVNDKDKLAQFGCGSDGTTCPRLSSFLNTLLAIYRPVNELLCHINDGDDAIDLSVLAYHISNIPAYANNARFLVQPYKAPAGSQTPVASSATPPPAYGQPPAPSIALVPAPTYADGWQPPPIPVAVQPSYPLPQGGYATPGMYMPQPTGWEAYGAPRGYPSQSPLMPAQPLPPPFDPPYANYTVQNQQPQWNNFVPNMPPGIYR